jgi:hypothetical protein
MEGFFERPIIHSQEPAPAQVRRYTVKKESPESKEMARKDLEANILLADLREQRIANQHNLDILWRAQILTLLSFCISTLSLAIAVVSLIIVT